MDMKDFAYLIALAEEGSVSKAAERLFMAQSSLSQFLQQFESELKVRLFIRTSKGIRPTQNGAVFIEHLRQLTDAYQQAKTELWDNENMKGGRVAFGISSFRGQRMLPKILSRFAEKYPDVTVDVTEEHSLKLEDTLLEGRLDAAIVAMPAAKLKNEISFLMKDEVYIAAPKGHPVMQRARPRKNGAGHWIELKDAEQHNFILSYHDTMLGNISRSLFQKHKLKYTASHENISAAMSVAMAREGLGLAFTYASCVEPSERLELLRIGREGVFLDLGLALPSREYHSCAAAALAEVVREVYTEESRLMEA